MVNSSIGDELLYLFGRENPDVVLLRWLRARKWHVPTAVQLMMDTLKWRCEWGLQTLIEKGENDLIKEECASGKIYTMGKDKMGRPITYIHAKQHIKGQYPLEATEKLVIFSIETARLLNEPPIEEGTVVIDMFDVGLQNLDYQHIKFMINVMQNYYPESLGLCLVVNAPWAFNTVWSVIKSWLDPVVASKIHFIKNSIELTEYIDPISLPKRLGGNHTDFEFIPPTMDDEVLIKRLRQDKQNFEKALIEHREAAKYYINKTLEWAIAEKQSEQEILNRISATERLNVAFKQLVPYISTRTYLHRIGDIQEPMFSIMYDHVSIENRKPSF